MSSSPKGPKKPQVPVPSEPQRPAVASPGEPAEQTRMALGAQAAPVVEEGLSMGLVTSSPTPKSPLADPRVEHVTVALENLLRCFVNGNHYDSKNPYARMQVKDGLLAVQEIRGKKGDWMDAVKGKDIERRLATLQDPANRKAMEDCIFEGRTAAKVVLSPTHTGKYAVVIKAAAPDTSDSFDGVHLMVEDGLPTLFSAEGWMEAQGVQFTRFRPKQGWEIAAIEALEPLGFRKTDLQGACEFERRAAGKGADGPRWIDHVRVRADGSVVAEALNLVRDGDGLVGYEGPGEVFSHGEFDKVDDWLKAQRPEEDKVSSSPAEKALHNAKVARILGHDVSYWYRDFDPLEMPESEVEHVKEMIRDGYVCGELCYYDNETEAESRGWWEIVKP